MTTRRRSSACRKLLTPAPRWPSIARPTACCPTKSSKYSRVGPFAIRARHPADRKWPESACWVRGVRARGYLVVLYISARRPQRRERVRAVRRVRQLAEIVTVRLYNKHLNPLAAACERDEVPPGRPLSGDRPYRQRRGSVQAGRVRVYIEKPFLADGRKERREHHSGSVR